MENVKNIILDYGNVLFEIDFNRTQQAFTKLGVANSSTFFSHASHHSLFNEFETGKLTASQFRNGIREAAGQSDLSDQEIDSAWNSLLVGIPSASIHNLLLTLRKRYRLFLLSNNNEIHYNWIVRYLEETYNLKNYDNHFEKAYFSQLMGVRKPSVEIFDRVLEENQLDRTETLFIDDSPQHIEGAKKAGIRTLLMNVHPEKLEQFLKSHQIL